MKVKEKLVALINENREKAADYIFHRFSGEPWCDGNCKGDDCLICVDKCINSEDQEAHK